MKDVITRTVTEGEKIVQGAHQEIERRIDPIRKNAFTRFPFIFTLFGTFGIASVFYGFELLLSKSSFLTEQPWVIVVIGVVALFGTGKLYQKLD